ncbi:hypothetical protein [Leeuwenhoekiella nanhaiensis]|uniref:Uncharacterized protein n=1 Tax=Leeuwenhoekiella nanhaiensis TaxID=1655491 RepID=A0A2G1VXN2_9FLAO|nr:hypothetical protein [Leeuwenhoekiella nanhaiensis]PHQ31189.1 hypothetical protein CJ305_02935 [Leeuwenhoekiella nanhaiensis]
MSKERIEIKLEYVGDDQVDLQNMSLQALESFLLVTTSLKNIAENITKDVTFTIKKGSAYSSVNGSTSAIENIYKSIDQAISGESNDEVITSNLRNIQREIQNQVFKYQFKYADFKLDERIKKAKKITKKRSNSQYEKELAIVSGFFNSIGGNDPNYHFDFGFNNRLKVECNILDVDELKDYLYKNISCLVLKKFSEEDNEKTSYTHLTVFEDGQEARFRPFIKKLNKETDIFRRLDLIYEFIDASTSRIKDLKVLLKSYDSIFNDINEFKTLLILTKSLKNNEEIKDYRSNLLTHFEHTLDKI